MLVHPHQGYKIVGQLLLEKGVDLKAKDNKSDCTPLSWAAMNGHESVVQLLLEKGADFEAKDCKYGQIPVLWAWSGTSG